MSENPHDEVVFVRVGEVIQPVSEEEEAAAAAEPAPPRVYIPAAPSVTVDGPHMTALDKGVFGCLLMFLLCFFGFFILVIGSVRR